MRDIQIVLQEEPEVVGKPWVAERAPRDYDWEPCGYGKTEAQAVQDLLDAEWELYCN